MKINAIIIILMFFYAFFKPMVSANDGLYPHMTTPSDGAKSAQIEVESILKKVEEIYKNADSYRDSGVITTTTPVRDKIFTSYAHFVTAYVKPNQIRFELAQKFPFPNAKVRRDMVTYDGNEAVFYDFDAQEKTSRASISHGLGTLVGVSKGTSGRIPALLFDDTRISRKVASTQNHQATLLEEGLINSQSYFRVEMLPNRAKGIVEVLWINKTTYLIHKIEAYYKGNRAGKHKTIITYKPTINVHVLDSELALYPPRTKDF